MIVVFRIVFVKWYIEALTVLVGKTQKFCFQFVTVVSSVGIVMDCQTVFMTWKHLNQIFTLTMGVVDGSYIIRDITEGATHYHADYVTPAWAKTKTKTIEIEDHIFYRWEQTESGMNIFYLNHDPKICAQMHNDSHCSKMIIEYAQLMSTAHRYLDGEQYYGKTANGRKIARWKLNSDLEHILYKASHIKHPSGIYGFVSQSQTTSGYMRCGLN